MVLVTVEKIGGLFFSSHDQDKWERNQGLVLAWLCMNYYTQFWDVINVEVGMIKAINWVVFHQLDRTQRWVVQNNLMEDPVNCMAKLYGLHSCKG